MQKLKRVIVGQPNWPMYGNGDTAKDLRRAINEMSNVVLRSIHPVLDDCRCTCSCNCGCEPCTNDNCEQPDAPPPGLDCSFTSGDQVSCGASITILNPAAPAGCNYNAGDSCTPPWGPAGWNLNCNFATGDPASCDPGCEYRAAESCVPGWVDCSHTVTALAQSPPQPNFQG